MIALLRELYGAGVERLKTEHKVYKVGSKKIDTFILNSLYHMEINVADAGSWWCMCGWVGGVDHEVFPFTSLKWEGCCGLPVEGGVDRKSRSGHFTRYIEGNVTNGTTRLDTTEKFQGTLKALSSGILHCHSV